MNKPDWLDLVLGKIVSDFIKLEQRYSLGEIAKAKQSILNHINNAIGPDEHIARGSTQDPTNPKNWTKRAKYRNELRAEQRKRLGL